MNKNKKHIVIAGKFRLLHNAHKELIIKATTLPNIEHLHILICNDSSYKRYSSLQELKSSITAVLKNLDVDYSINIVDAVENKNNNPLWDKLVIKTVKENVKNANINDIVILNSKENYKNYLIDNYFLKCTLNNKIGVSDIENNPYDYNNFYFIAKEFQPYMNKKVVVSGVESSGKTVLSTKLAKLFNTEISEEYGRYYAGEVLQGNDDAFLPKDFVFIATNQMLQDKKKNFEANRVLIVDTDPIVTLRFLKSYKEHYVKSNINIGQEWEEEYRKAYNLLTEICKSYKSDLVLLLKPNCTYVQDGTRWKQEQIEREEHYKELKNLYNQFNIKYIEINEDNWEDKLKSMEEKINNIL